MRNRFLLGGLLLAAFFLALVPRASNAQSLTAEVQGFNDMIGGYPAEDASYVPTFIRMYYPYWVTVSGTLTGVPGVGVFSGLPGISKLHILAAECDYSNMFAPVNGGYHFKGEKLVQPSYIMVGLPGLQLPSLANYPSTYSDDFTVLNEDQGYYRWMGQVFADRDGGGLPPEAPSTAFSTDGGVLWATSDYHSS